MDITNKNRVYEVSKEILSKHSVDIIINNAGIVGGDGLLNSNDILLEKTIQVNTISHFWILKSFLPDMKKRNSGHIVTIASSAGLTGVPKLVD